MKVIFLDIDGVLNNHEPVHPEVLSTTLHTNKVAKLNHILRQTGAKIVLTSAWRYFVHRGEMNIAGLDWLLRTHGILAKKLIGVTGLDTMTPANTPYDGDPKTWPMPNERGKQISDWIEWWNTGIVLGAPDRVENYVVIDDMDLGITAAGHPLVLVDGVYGLQHSGVRTAIKILNQLRNS